ncbi:MAG: ATP-grasp domain-containing protein [Methanophagales archaeon]|nr:ATP-grasp domain-containing protein [Methanophagales archaeon]
MKIMVAEYAVGARGDKGSSLLREGKAMLTTLRRGFERLDNEVVYPVAAHDFEAAVDKLSRESDAGIVIAPDEKLYELTELVESNTVNLGCPSECVKICADKMRTTKILADKGIPVPRIVSEEEMKRDDAWKSVYVRKPRYGCASENVFIVNGKENQEDIPFDDNRDHIVTEFIKGEDISSSVIAGDSFVLPLTINQQFIRMEQERLIYEGGLVPYLVGRDAEKKIRSISKKVVAMLNCKGYVGIDFVLEYDDTPYVVDVNPRPTTSIVGIAKVLNYEVADLILRAKFGTLPREEEVKTEGCFTLKLTK